MSIVSASPASPFKGLAAFEDSQLDALFFFGREREREVIVANLLASRLTVLYGESGVGKSSLLAAAVVRDLRESTPDEPIVLHSRWSDGTAGLTAQFEDRGGGYLILDQFEEYFLYHDDAHPGTLLHELPELLATTRVNILLALREDSLARLDAFKARIPGVFANQLRLEHLDVEQARRAILGPLARWEELTGEHVDAEPALVEAVLDSVAIGEGHVEAPYLQLVLARVWAAEQDAGSWLLRRSTLDRLGGAAAIVREQFRGALESLTSDEQDVAAAMFEHLVTPTGTKIALDVADLAEYASVREDVLRGVLSRLTTDRIVHSVDGSDRYEIFHDVLAEPIGAWRLERRFAAERAAAQRRQRRLLVVAVVALVALAVVAALAIWALSERSNARAQARHSRARALDATALQQLTVDPNRSVHLALDAIGLESGPGTESVLRQALVADRLRLVKHAEAPVSSVAASPRGDLLAAAVAGARVLLLDAASRRVVRTIATPRPVAEVSFADGGRRLVTASPQRLAQLWDVRTGKRIVLPARMGAARAPDGSLRLVPLAHDLARAVTHLRQLVVAPGGAALAAIVANATQGARAWAFDGTGRLVRVLPQRGVSDLAFSPDGRLLATAGQDGLTEVWNARSARSVRELLDAKSGVNAVAFSPDGGYLASAGEDGGVRIWNVADGERTFFLFGHTNPVKRVAWSPDGRVVATSAADGSVLLWRVQHLIGAGSLAATLAGSQGLVGALAFSHDSARLVTGGADRTIRVWDARPDQQLRVVGRAAGPALAAAWAEGAIVGLWPGVVKTFTAAGAPLHALRAPGRTRFTSLGVAGNGSVIAAGADDGTTHVWSTRTGDELSTFGGGGRVVSVAVSADGALVASGDRSGAVVVRTPGGVERWRARQPGAVADLAFSRSTRALVGTGRRGATVWDAATGRRLHVLASPSGDSSAVFSPDGTLVATAGNDGDGRLWFARTGNLYRVLRGHRQPLTDIVFSADGRLAATSSRDGDGRVWNVVNGAHFALQRGAFGPLAAIAFDPSGLWLAGAAPISVILWSEASGRQLFYLRGHTAPPPVTAVSFASASPTVLSASADGTIRTYRCEVCADRDALVHLAKVRLARTR